MDIKLIGGGNVWQFILNLFKKKYVYIDIENCNHLMVIKYPDGRMETIDYD